MRVTNKMLAGNFLRDMRANLSNMKTLQNQLTSGKEIRRPSDDPFKVARAMQLHTDISVNKQYNENIKDTINALDTTDTALNQGGNVLQRVRELLVSAGNAAYGDNEKRAIKDEINEKIAEFAQIMNSNFDGKYVFGGTKTSTKPVDARKDDDGSYHIYFLGKDGVPLESSMGANNMPNRNPLTSDEFKNIGSKLKTEISQGVVTEYNATATEVFQFKDTKGNQKDLMQVFDNIIEHFKSGKTSDLTSGDLSDITSAMDNVLKIRSRVGSLENRMDSAKDKNETENFNMTDILSKTEDIDITEKVMEFSTMQTVYTASLQTSAKVIQPSLLDYLR